MKKFSCFFLIFYSIRLFGEGLLVSPHQRPQFSLYKGYSKYENITMRRGSLSRDDKGEYVSIYQFSQEIKMNNFTNIGYIGRINKGDMFFTDNIEEDPYTYFGLSFGLFSKFQYIPDSLKKISFFAKTTGSMGILAYKLPGVIFYSEIQLGYSFYFNQWFGVFFSYGPQWGILKETIFSSMRKEDADKVFESLGLSKKGTAYATTHSNNFYIGVVSTYW